MRVQQMTEDCRQWIEQMQDPITGGSRFWKQKINDAPSNPKAKPGNPKTKSETRAAQRAKKRAQRKARAGGEKDN
ncbi:MAG: hypothetical protein ACR2OA_11525 [Rubripirellula sp.]|jgi:hypothetical protein